MRLKSLSNAELIEEITWSKCYMMIREMESRYPGQSKAEQTKEYHELHETYRKYWDEAFRRGMVDKNSEELEKS